jgi:hypothetical protein
MSQPPSVFIVEDEALIAMELRDRLTRLGYAVAGVAARGEAAADAIPAAAPDVVLMDVSLAGKIDGIEAARRVRDRLDVPVVFLTAFSDPELLRRASEVGPYGYLVKPFEERELHATLQMALDKHRMERALRAASRQLEEQAQTFQDLFEFAPDALVLVDCAGVVRRANRQAEQTFGWSRGELLGQPVEVLLVPEDRAAHVAKRQEYTRGPAVPRPMGQERTNLRAARKDGAVFPVEVSLAPLRVGGELMIAAAIRDATARRRMEQQLARAQRLEAVGALAGGIAHDLNNALTPVVMALGQLRADRPDAADLLDVLDAGATRAVGMVRQLLTFAKGKAEGPSAAVALAPMAREVERIVRSTFPKSVRFRADVPPDLPPVAADPTQLHQILLNLCVNARDAMPAGGTLTLAARAADLTAAEAAALGEPDARPGRYVVACVTDTGEGIAPDVLDHIFEPFFTTKGPEQGTGLGLFTVLGAAKRHGGFVRVRSRVGAGTEFAVYLPAGTAAAPAPPPEPPGARGRGELVLVVDDDDGVRSTLRAVLSALGFRVVMADGGAAALALADERRDEVAAVITDLHMPGMSGLELAGELRRRWPALPVLAVSGLLGDAEAARLRAVGVEVLLSKPFSQEQLLTAVQTALRARVRPGA